MTDLIACLSTGKGTWGHVSRLMQAEEWSKIILVSNDFGRERFSSDKEFELVVVDNRLPVTEMARKLHEQLDGTFTDLEVAVNIISGSGAEHMALLSALMRLGVGYRLVALDPDGNVTEL